jgi:hypothetical protein
MTTEMTTRDLDYAMAICREMSNDFRFTVDDVDADLTAGATQYAAAYDGTFDFMLDMRAAARNRGLSVGMVKGVLNCMLADVRKARRAATPAVVLDMAGLNKLFAGAGQHLKAPRITLALDDGTPVTVRLMTRGSHVGAINVQTGGYYDGTWYGRVEPDGTLISSRFMTDAVRALLTELATDPVAAAKRFAALTGNCCFCNRELTDDRSTSVGYGPICAGHYGLPWG